MNVLEVTLRQTRDRFTAGEVTRTDVAQAESRLAAGRSQLSLAESNYVTAQAQYQQVIGVPAPARLAPAAPVDRLSPRTLDGAIARGRTEHPPITTAMYNVDVAVQQVKIAEGALYPTLSAVGSVQKTFGSASALAVLETLSASVGAQLSVPIYQGGSEYSTIRQAKETLGQRRLDLDTARDQVQSTVTQAWGQLEAAKAQINATQAQVTAAEVALNGVREEARVGQRTTLDVLNAQQDLVNARVALVTAQRDRVVASYTVLAATGALSPQVLGLKIEVYDPVRALSAGARRLGRRAHARRALIQQLPGCACGDPRSTRATVCLRPMFGMPYSFYSGGLVRCRFCSIRRGARTAGGRSGDASHESAGEGSRAFDGGNSRLHPQDHRRRRSGPDASEGE